MIKTVKNINDAFCQQIHVSFIINPYNKVTGCLSVCLFVCLYVCTVSLYHCPALVNVIITQFYHSSLLSTVSVSL